MTVPTTTIRRESIAELNQGLVKLNIPVRPIQPKKKSKSFIRSKVMVFVRQLMKHGGLSFGDAQRYAWDEIPSLVSKNAKVVVFWKVDSKTGKRSKVKRLVYMDWSNYYKVKGTGRPAKPGQIFFADITRIQCGKHPIISTYADRIIEIY